MLTLKRFGVTTVLVASMAMPATSAAQQDLRNPDRQAPVAEQTQDLRSPDRQAPVAQQPQDLRNADRRAPEVVQDAPVEPPVITAIEVPAAQGFDWGDAAIGAAGAIALLSMLAGLTLAATQRRRGSGIPA